MRAFRRDHYRAAPTGAEPAHEAIANERRVPHRLPDGAVALERDHPALGLGERGAERDRAGPLAHLRRGCKDGGECEDAPRPWRACAAANKAPRKLI